MTAINIEEITTKIGELLTTYGLRFLGAVAALIVGLWVVSMVTSLFKKTLAKRAAIDESLKPFLTNLVSILLKAALFITVAGMVGIETTSFVALLGAAGLAIGFALQGTLGNFAGGVLILLLKPFKIGDFIEAQGFSGSVKEIQIFCTIMNTPDNKHIILPNGPLAGGSIVNYSTESTRRVDFVFGIGYDDDLKKAKNLLQKIVTSDSRILKDPEPMVVVSELADSSVNFTVRTWVNSGDYWPVHFDTIEKVKLEFDANGISIPFPQTDIHVHGLQSGQKIAAAG